VDSFKKSGNFFEYRLSMEYRLYNNNSILFILTIQFRVIIESVKSRWISVKLLETRK